MFHWLFFAGRGENAGPSLKELQDLSLELEAKAEALKQSLLNLK